jgi:beta-N-acetylglucosaminidase/Glycosyl hydrolase family 20, domain 2
MRKRNVYILLLVLTGCLFLQAANGARLANLIPNPGLEQGTKIPLGGWMPHHFIANDWSRYSSAKLDSTTAHSGSKSIKLTVKVPVERTLDWRILSINIKKYKRLKLAFWMKTKGVKSGRQSWQTAHVTLYVSYGKRGLKALSCGRAEGDTDWTKYEKVFDLPKDAKSIRVSAGLSICSGTVWFDDFLLIPTNEPVTNPVSISDLAIPELSKQPAVLPSPKQAKYTGKTFSLGRIVIVTNDTPSAIVGTLKKLLGDDVAIVKSMKGAKAIKAQTIIIAGRQDNLLTSTSVHKLVSQDELKTKLRKEGYLLNVSDQSGKTVVLLCGKDFSGVFYGVQTLKQLLKHKKSGMTLPECKISDWPDMAVRGVPSGRRGDRFLKRMVAVKLNLLFMCMKEGQQYIDRELKSREKQRLQDFVAKTANMYIQPVASIRPATYKIWKAGWFEYSNPAHLQKILDRCADYYSAGFRKFAIHFDDIPSRRFKYKKDKERFGTLGKAHLYVAEKMYDYIKKLDTANQMYFIPMYYNNPSKSSKVVEAKQYLQEIGKLNKNIIFTFCEIFTTKDATFCKSLVGKRRLLLWDNYLCQYENRYEGKPALRDLIKPFSIFSKSSKKLSKSVFGYIFLMPLDNFMAWRMSADYMWNSQTFNPKKSAAIAVTSLK